MATGHQTSITATDATMDERTGTTSSPQNFIGAVTGIPRLWLRAEGAAAFVAGAGLYFHLGGQLVWVVPLLLAVDVSAIGYVVGPRAGAIGYNLAHNWAVALAVLGLAWWFSAPTLALIGAILFAHTGFDRLAGYGLKYPGAFGETHLGRLGKGNR
jgi:hypothetical protein